MAADVNVSIDDKQTCVGVHWNTGLEAAERQFSRWGFRGISDFHKVEVLNGNEARTHVLDIARRQDVKCYWRGNYDWGVGADSAIYRFSYDEYVGDVQVHGDAETAKLHADWSP